MNMSRNLYDHNVYQKQEFKVSSPKNHFCETFFQVEKPTLSPATRENRKKRFSGEFPNFNKPIINSGQHPTGVDLIKPNQDEFQDFLDMVDPIIKNAKGSSDGEFKI